MSDKITVMNDDQSNVAAIPMRKDKRLDWLARGLEASLIQNSGDAVMIRLDRAEAIALVRILDQKK